MSGIIKKVSELKRAFELKGNEFILINQENSKTKIFSTIKLPISSILNFYKKDITNILKNKVNVGDIIAYSGKLDRIDEIEGWLLCNGQKILRNKYKDLDNLIGGIYGERDSTHFYLPSIAGRTIMGYCSTGNSFNLNNIQIDNNFLNFKNESLIFGSYNNSSYRHKLIYDELPKHIHTVVGDHDHVYFDVSNVATMDISDTTFAFLTAMGVPRYKYMMVDVYIPREGGPPRRGIGNYKFPDTTPFLTLTQGKRILNGLTLTEEVSNRLANGPYDKTKDTKTTISNIQFKEVGGNLLHNNTQPYNVINYLIKY
jgi:microcystin-dependent protein